MMVESESLLGLDDSRAGINLLLKKNLTVEFDAQKSSLRQNYSEAVKAIKKDSETLLKKDEPVSREVTKLLRPVRRVRVENWASDTDDSNTGFTLDNATQTKSNLGTKVTDVLSEVILGKGSSTVVSNATSKRVLAVEASAQPVEESLPKGFLPKQEVTDERVEKRQRQIDLGKATEGYLNYRKFYPKTEENQKFAVEEKERLDKLELEREKKILEEQGETFFKKKDNVAYLFPVTPRKDDRNLSKRDFDKVLKRWRRSLHQYDEIRSDSDFKKFVEKNQNKKHIRRKRKLSRVENVLERKGKKSTVPKRSSEVRTPALNRKRM